MMEYYVGRDGLSTRNCIMSPQNMAGKSALQNGSRGLCIHQGCKIGGTKRTWLCGGFSARIGAVIFPVNQPLRHQTMNAPPLTPLLTIAA